MPQRDCTTPHAQVHLTTNGDSAGESRVKSSRFGSIPFRIRTDGEGLPDLNYFERRALEKMTKHTDKTTWMRLCLRYDRRTREVESNQKPGFALISL